jgi:hypothetical protein
VTDVEELSSADEGGRAEQAWWALAAGTVLFCLRYVTDRQWGRDYWEHAAAVLELARRPIHPHNPYTGDPGRSILLDPWHLIVAQLARLDGLGVERAIQTVAVVQLIAVLFALRAIVRHFIEWRWAPVTFLAATLVLWGWQPWVWSGLPDLNGIGFVVDDIDHGMPFFVPDSTTR